MELDTFIKYTALLVSIVLLLYLYVLHVGSPKISPLHLHPLALVQLAASCQIFCRHKFHTYEFLIYFFSFLCVTETCKLLSPSSHSHSLSPSSALSLSRFLPQLKLSHMKRSKGFLWWFHLDLLEKKFFFVVFSFSLFPLLGHPSRERCSHTSRHFYYARYQQENHD